MNARDITSPVKPSSLRPGWRVTPLGRLVRPMRMRPLRPLGFPASVAQSKMVIDNGKKKKERKKKRGEVLVRQRRRRIDPEEWGSTYLSGIMLESSTASAVVLPEKSRVEMDNGRTTEQRSDSDNSESESDSGPRHESMNVPTPSSPPATTNADPPTTHPQPESDIAKEAKQSLALLDSLFGGRRSIGAQIDDSDGDDWGGEESLSDVDMRVDDLPESHASVPIDGEDDDIEYVPRQPGLASKATAKGNKDENKVIETEDSSTEAHKVQHLEPQHEPVPERGQEEPKVQTTKLKDMFAPRPQDGKFSN